MWFLHILTLEGRVPWGTVWPRWLCKCLYAPRAREPTTFSSFASNSLKIVPQMAATMEQKGVWQLICMKLSETQESATGVIFCENCKVKDSKMCVGDFESNKRKKKSGHFCFFLEMDLNLPNRGSPLQSCSFIDHDGGSQDIKTIFLHPTSLQGK